MDVKMNAKNREEESGENDVVEDYNEEDF